MRLGIIEELGKWQAVPYRQMKKHHGINVCS
jgi:hypothetical protein